MFNKINLNPSVITIFTSGNVVKTGPQVIRKGSTLVQAIAYTGGKKLFSGKIEFIRFNNEGDIERRLLRYDPNAKVDSFSNPLLVEGDIINVKRTPLGVASESLKEISTPILRTILLTDIIGGIE